MNKLIKTCLINKKDTSKRCPSHECDLSSLYALKALYLHYTIVYIYFQELAL